MSDARDKRRKQIDHHFAKAAHEPTVHFPKD